MNLRKLVLSSLGLACAAHLSVARAAMSDIDVFYNRNATENEVPNVLFVIDMSANGSAQTSTGQTYFAAEMASLKNVFNWLQSNAPSTGAKLNVGAVFSNGSSGAFIRTAIRPMSSSNATIYANYFGALDPAYDKDSNVFSGYLMAEAYRYLSRGSGTSPLSLPNAGKPSVLSMSPTQTTPVKADYTGNGTTTWSNPTKWGNPAQNTPFNALYALNSTGNKNALPTRTATQFNALPSSGTGEGCVPKNFIIYISNGVPQDTTYNATKDYATMFVNANNGVAPTFLKLANGDSTASSMAGNLADEWAQLLKKSAVLNATTYSVDILPTTNSQGVAWTNTLQNMAKVSSGRYFAVNTLDGSALFDALKNIFGEVLAQNSTFASVSLPVSANTQGAYLNQVFIGMFRPDGTGKARWFGNLKQYQLGLDTSQATKPLVTLDANGSPAILSSSGFIDDCAQSFWSTTNTYWSFNPQGTCSHITGYTPSSDAPDGPVVEKGAQAQTLRAMNPATRKGWIWTTGAASINSCALTSLALLNNTGTGSCAPQSLLDSSGANTQAKLLNWATGTDVDDENLGGQTTDTRPSVHGDVLHSRPFAVDFGSSISSPKVVVFYGANDGVFRAINGNQTGSVSNKNPGEEIWGFVPPEFISSVNRLYNNNVLINYTGQTASGTAAKPYGMDGVIAAQKIANNDYYIYATMRRGGRAMYIFRATYSSDVLNMTFVKRIGCNPDGSNCIGPAFAQTWAKPSLGTVSAYSGNLMLVGGGYDDSCEDATTPCSSPKGNAVFVLDAATGTLLKTLSPSGMRGVIADIQIVNDSSGNIKYAYVADLGGNLYRITTGDSQPSNWTISTIAKLGCSSGASSCSNMRKFMFAPDVVETNGVYYLLTGSGDREKPVAGGSLAQNYFFSIKDDPVNNPNPSSPITTDSLATVTAGTPLTATQQQQKPAGWMMTLGTQEAVVTSSITIYGTTFFSTYTPYDTGDEEKNTCNFGLGKTQLYSVEFQSVGKKKPDTLPPVGLPPSPVAGMVRIGSNTLPFCIGCDKTSPLQAFQPTPPSSSTPTRPKVRTYWFQKR